MPPPPSRPPTSRPGRLRPRKRYGGERSLPAQYFLQTPADFSSLRFSDADPRVVATATARRPRDPCRDIGSAPSAIAADEMGLAKVTVPVLVVSGAEDRLFLPPTPRRQAGAFSGSRDVTAVELPRTGHAVTLGRSAPGFTRVVARWLGHRGF